MTKATIIAECCQNHNGRRDVLKTMIHEAADAGADYVKIQAIRSKELVRRERFEAGVVDASGVQLAIKRPFQVELERLSKLDLSLEDEAWFVTECRRAGIAPMTTVFTRASVRDVCDMGFEAVKIASYDCASYPLLQDVKQYWSTVFVSTGATYDDEIARAASILEGTTFSLLHCVTIYPTPMHELHLQRLGFLRRWTPRVGFSDHTMPANDKLWASKIALALGANVIERHFTVLPKDQTKDGPVSITSGELKELRAFADRPRREQMEVLARDYPEWEKSLGKATRDLSRAELLNRDYYRGRFASKVGDVVVQNWEDISLDHAATTRAST